MVASCEDVSALAAGAVDATASSYTEREDPPPSPVEQHSCVSEPPNAATEAAAVRIP